jgi:hypothetical protein
MKAHIIYSPSFLPVFRTNHATTIEQLLGSAAKRLLKFVYKKANDKTAQINHFGDPQ